jgi:RNA polymerase sigma factor (TIGR02999 family)
VSQPTGVTGLLQAWGRGDVEALEQLAPLVHAELRQMARRLLAGEGRSVWYEPTDLVHETYVRLLDWKNVRWQNRAHFFVATARMMRRVLVDLARSRRASKRGAAFVLVPLETSEVAASAPPVDIVALSDALDALAAVAPRPSQVVELRFFGGFSVEETADALRISPRTVINDWNTARVWLFREIKNERPDVQ